MTATLSTRLFAVGIAAEAMKDADHAAALIEAAGIVIATQALLADDPTAALDRLLDDFNTGTRRLVNLTAGDQIHGEAI